MSDICKSLATAAENWRDIDFPGRASAIEATLGADNRFTEEAIHFAVNQQIHQLTEENLRSWVGDRKNGSGDLVCVLNPGNVPFADLQDFVAAVITGCSYRGSVSKKSPFLLPAFAMDVKRALPTLNAEFVSRDQLFPGAAKVIATGNDAALDWTMERVRDANINEDDVLLRGWGFGVGILSGNETPDQLEHLAEDALLHEGRGCRNVAVLFAPEGYDPDPLLDAFAHFRGVFPAHAETGGAIELQRAFLAAVESPHAYGEDMSFLLSKGQPEVQQPGHIRLVEYKSIDEAKEWITENDDSIQVIVSAQPDRIDDARSEAFGSAQRPRLGWNQSGFDVIDFLCREEG